jgi:hypothetical protein
VSERQAHTPGPWEIDATSNVGAFEIWGGPLDSNAPQICSDDGDLNRPEECKANASLIAAAPDMLAALQSLDEFAWSAMSADCKEAHDNLSRKLAVMRAAIAKAEGRS